MMKKSWKSIPRILITCGLILLATSVAAIAQQCTLTLTGFGCALLPSFSPGRDSLCVFTSCANFNGTCRLDGVPMNYKSYQDYPLGLLRLHYDFLGRWAVC